MTPLQCATNQGHQEIVQLLNDYIQNNKDSSMRNIVPFSENEYSELMSKMRKKTKFVEPYDTLLQIFSYLGIK